MTKIALSALALVAVAGTASASLFAGYPVDVDPATLSDAQRAAINLAVNSSDSAAEIVRQIASIAK